ncbi:MAG TPA: HD domain-containing protein [Armatimonadota bacterium]|nr:HD domain-containing protein [Armatimonadota bacterium]
MMVVRCPIHGLIEYGGLEERVINSRAMQRLRGIHQLAMAYLVYPGAVHTRFDHSLGVMHVAGRMAKVLGFSKREIGNIRLAALLHDVGHGPFSHVSDTSLTGLSAGYADGKRIDAEKLHECITVDVINHDDELRGILGARREDITRLIDTVNYAGRTAARHIISGPLDYTPAIS